MDREILAMMVKLRGIGFSTVEIGEIIGVSQATVSYNLKVLKTDSVRYGIDKVFYSTIIFDEKMKEENTLKYIMDIAKGIAIGSGTATLLELMKKHKISKGTENDEDKKI